MMAIITTIGTMVIIGYQNQSLANQRVSMANIVKAGAEKYYNENNEYPTAGQLNTPANAAKLLGTNESALTTASLTATPFIFCAYSPSANPSCKADDSTNISRMFYIARDQGATSDLSITFPPIEFGKSCSITFNASTPSDTTNAGPTAFATVFYSPETKNWVVQKSNHGAVVTDAGCQTS